MTWEESYKQLLLQHTSLKAKREMTNDLLSKTKKKRDLCKRKLKAAEKVRVIIQDIAQKTLANLSFHISSIVSSALYAVFPDAPPFEAIFIKARNQMECWLWLIKDGVYMKPIESSGGGLCDVISFALRITHWTLSPTRPTFILDEPFKFVSVDLQPRCAEMVRMLAESEGLQIVMVSHLPEITMVADREYLVKLDRGISKLTERR